MVTPEQRRAKPLRLEPAPGDFVEGDDGAMFVIPEQRRAEPPHDHNWFESRGHPPTDESGRELAPGTLFGYWCACGAMVAALPVGRGWLGNDKDPEYAALRRVESILDEAVLSGALSSDERRTVTVIEAAYLRSLLADPRVERLEAVLTPEAFAKALTRIRGAHNNADYETEEGEPCGWCRLAGEQAAEAARALLRSPQERSGK